MISEKGFTLIEIMVSLGIIGILALAGINASQMMNQATEYAERTQSAVALGDLIRERLKYSDLCSQTLAQASGMSNVLNPATMTATPPEIKLRIPGLEGGVNMTSETLEKDQVLPTRHLIVKSLRLINGANVSGSTYVAQVELQLASTSGQAMKPAIPSTVQFALAGTAINECKGANSGLTTSICTSMGCTWDSSQVPACRCEKKSEFCPTGQYPTSFAGGVPVCQSLGGTCPPNQYLVSAGIGTVQCAPVGP